LVGEAASPATRESFRRKLRGGELDDKEIEIQLRETGSGFPAFEIPGMPGASIGVMNLNEMLGKAFGTSRTKSRTVTVRDSRDLLVNEESDRLLDNDGIVQEAISAAENDGIVFIDEIDKICAREGASVPMSRARESSAISCPLSRAPR
jgi:ATP-dependent HslUV protease ATP-binding subunit HslU